MDMNDILEALRQMPAFAGIPDKNLRLIAVVGQWIAFEPEEVILEPGELSDGVYFLTEGAVELRHPQDNRVVMHAEHGHVLGLASILTQQPVPLACVASKEARALYIAGDDFLSVLEKIPKLSVNLLREFAGSILAHGRRAVLEA